jgi:hypothetical protein
LTIAAKTRDMNASVRRVFDDDLDNEAILLVHKAKRLLLCHFRIHLLQKRWIRGVADRQRGRADE